MIRRIINISEEKCNGCGLCVNACHEGAIGLVNGKAQLKRDDYCDGLGDCLPVCPTNAITFEEREALEYNEAEVKKNMESNKKLKAHKLPCGCPGSQSKTIKRANTCDDEIIESNTINSQLTQWPVQIKLAPINAPYFENADLLIAADCTAYAYGDFHNRFIKNRRTLIGCPKLDEGNYADKLTDVLVNNSINSITVVRMQVPCCGGIVNAVNTALKNSQKDVPLNIVTISTDGKIK